MSLGLMKRLGCLADEGRKHLVRLPLIPVTDRGEVQGQAVVVPVFDAEAERLLEVDGIGDMKSMAACKFPRKKG